MANDFKRVITVDASGNPASGSGSDQDPIFDHANGTKVAVTTSASVITPPAGCKYLRISADVDVVVNTAGVAAVDNGHPYASSLTSLRRYPSLLASQCLLSP
jgi:hypothetical protein